MLPRKFADRIQQLRNSKRLFQESPHPKLPRNLAFACPNEGAHQYSVTSNLLFLQLPQHFQTAFARQAKINQNDSTALIDTKRFPQAVAILCDLNSIAVCNQNLGK